MQKYNLLSLSRLLVLKLAFSKVNFQSPEGNAYYFIFFTVQRYGYMDKPAIHCLWYFIGEVHLRIRISLSALSVKNDF
jgi:hypothetical protein